MSDDSLIAQNRRASFEYTYVEQFEAGLALQGWEVKSLRAGKANISQGYILVKNNEAWWVGGQITPMITASTHVKTDTTRTRKLLLHEREIGRLRTAVEQKGLTIIPLKLYWKKGRAKLYITLARGKKLVDKRETIKERDWSRQKQRVLKGQ
ncbi:MAG: SsrA-binding protein SmpB [Pseudomonadota bacterium]